MQFIIQLAELLFGLLESALRFSFEFIEEVITSVPKKNTGYKAEFAPAWTLLSSRYDGFCLTGRKNLSVPMSYQNALVVGGTGAGKSSVVLLPSLYTMRSSFIVHDPSGELHSKSAGYLRQRGYTIKVLNFANPSISSSYNPLERAQNSSDIQKISSILVGTSLGGNAKDPFWNLQATSLLTMLITILKTQDKKYQNLYNVRQLLNHLGGSPKLVDALFSRYADETLFAEYKSFLSYDQKVVTGVIATCKAALQIFSDELVAHITSSDNLTMQDFRTKPMVLFVQNSISDQRYYAVLTSLLFEQFFSFILGRFPQDNEKDIFLLIDEASSLNLPTLPMAVANVRKHRGGIMLIVQDFSQLVHHYGRYDADAIKTNCFSKLYFTGQSLETSKELEQTLGRFEYEDEEGKKNVRPLLTNDEIRMLKSSRALLICGHHAPVMVHLKPYYKNRTYKKYSSIPVPKMVTNLQNEPIPALNLDAKDHE